MMMQLDPLHEVIHQPARLRIMSLVYRRGDVALREAQRALELTAGNIDSHVRRLQEAGLLESRRVLMRDHFEVRLRPTDAGVAVFEDYLRKLEAFLRGMT